jgi:hypothetical protein
VNGEPNGSSAPREPATRARKPGRIVVLLVAALAPLLAAAHTYVITFRTDIAEMDVWRRLWDDLALALSAWVDAAYGPAPERVVAVGEDAAAFAQRRIVERIERDGLRPAQPLATLRPRPFVQDRIKLAAKPYDDKGRAVLLALAFRARGGIAPFLILWLGWLAVAPLLAWIAAELWFAGLRRTAVVFPVLLALSPFFVETLALARYAVGFYLVAVLAPIPLAVYGQCHPAPRLRGLVLRGAAAALLLGVCVYCRSSAALVLPGFVLATWLGVRRLLRGPRAWVAMAGATLVFAAPMALVGGAQQNDVWQPVWEGLGDFDRAKGYTWSDAVAEETARRSGANALWTPESEAVFRAQVLRDVASDPGWFAGILSRRLLATVTLWKLWPWRPLDGIFIRRHTAANEGVMDKYWTYTTTIDHVGVGKARVEVPIPLLAVSAIALLALAWSRQRRIPAREALWILGAAALGTLALPVLITTAGGQEAQAFGVVYLLAAALLPDVLRGAIRTRPNGGARAARR